MVTIDYTGLRLTGALCINRLTALELHVGVNEHGWAVVEGEAGENALELLQGAVAGREQVIMVRNETGAEQPLFAGVIRSAGLITYGGYNRFHIELQSGTIQMDQVKRSRSFQDVAQTYSQVAQRVASGYEDGAVIPTVGLDKPLEVPVIQYRETDWEFLKRLASWCGGVVVPETHYAYSRIWFGFPDRAFTCTFPEDCYTSGISQRYYELGGPVAGNRRADFFYYDVPSSQMCDLGWYTVFRGQEFLICEKWAKLERGELLFTYRLGKPGLGYGRKEYNDKISGMTILGEVLSTKRETVCLKLDIDQGWAPGGPYPYTWRPETGNMMYCMPQVGTRVSLYFPNYDEQAAIAVNCVRTNGESCARMSDPSKRSFVTEHGKEMNLYPDEMFLLGGANGTVKLQDETGITISTDKKIRITAEQSVLVNGKTLVMAAPLGELVLIKGNILTGEIETTVVQSNQYNLLAASFTHTEGRVFVAFGPYADSPEIAKENNSNFWAQIVGNAIVGLAVVGAVVILGSVGAAIAGVALGTIGVAAAITMGAAFAGTVIGAISDATSGEASSVGEAVVNSLSWGSAGIAFVTGGVPAFVLANLANIGRTAVSYLAKDILNQKFGDTISIFGQDLTWTGSLSSNHVEIKNGDSEKPSRNAETDEDDKRSLGIDILDHSISASMLTGEIAASYGDLSGEGKGSISSVEVTGKVGTTLYEEDKLKPALEANASASANLASAEGELKYTIDSGEIHGAASGEFLTAEASADLGIGTIEQKTKNKGTIEGFGLQATIGAEAYVAQGEISGGVEFLGVTVDVTLSGNIGGIGAKAGGAITTGGVGGEISGGLGVGGGLSFSITW